MTYAFYYDAPGTPEVYEMVRARIGSARPEGLLAHVVTSTGEGLRHLDVWDSREHWESFRDSTVRPAVAAVLSTFGVDGPTDPPVEHVLELVDVS